MEQFVLVFPFLSLEFSPFYRKNRSRATLFVTKGKTLQLDWNYLAFDVRIDVVVLWETLKRRATDSDVSGD